MNLTAYVHRDTVIHRLSGSTKVLLLAGGVLICLLFNDPLYSALCLTVALMGCAVAGAYVNLRVAWIPIAAFVAVTAVSWVFLYGQGRPIWHWGPLAVSAESIRFAATSVLRLTAMLVLLFNFLATVRQDELQRGLLALHVPHRVTFVLSLAIQLAVGYVGVAIAIAEAQAARGLDFHTSSLRKRLGCYLALAVPLLMHAVRQTDGLAIALESRGFVPGGRRTLLEQERLTVADGVARTGIGLLVLASILLRLSGRGAFA